MFSSQLNSYYWDSWWCSWCARWRRRTPRSWDNLLSTKAHDDTKHLVFFKFVAEDIIPLQNTFYQLILDLLKAYTLYPLLLIIFGTIIAHWSGAVLPFCKWGWCWFNVLEMASEDIYSIVGFQWTFIYSLVTVCNITTRYIIFLCLTVTQGLLQLN